MTNIRTNYGKEKGGKGLKNHFKKHKGVYITASISLATLVGLQVYDRKRLEYEIREAYHIGTKYEAIMTWNKLLEKNKLDIRFFHGASLYRI